MANRHRRDAGRHQAPGKLPREPEMLSHTYEGNCDFIKWKITCGQGWGGFRSPALMGSQAGGPGDVPRTAEHTLVHQGSQQLKGGTSHVFVDRR